ncbi:hypothetical protein [Paracoccus sp. SSK6]|uniref:hypothetical protein n=1 Tax=Paracoccus sp. SSK6 TaxID=3143131 RepID=UPI00321954DF
MADPVEAAVATVAQAAEALGWPVYLNHPFDLDEGQLPCVCVWTGSEETVSDGPAAAWAEEVNIQPIIEVLLEQDDPNLLAPVIASSWRTLRASLRATDWSKVTSSGSVPYFRKTALDVEDKTGVDGFAVVMRLRVELD